MGKDNSYLESEEKFAEFLKQSGVDVDQWGTGESKTLEHLISEIRNGESRLEMSEYGMLIRHIEGVGINVFFEYEGHLLRLEEERQVFIDGRERKRHLTTSLGEKMTEAETLSEAATRALEEELGLSGYLFDPNKAETQNKDVVKSSSFPGLLTKNTIHVFNIAINSGDFNPDGYIEYQEDKTTYFVWRKVNSE